jgi:hypothetical protein
VIIHILRGVAVALAGPLIGYTQVSADAKGLLVGLLASGFIIGIELLVERVPLDAIISAVIGAVIGLVAARLGHWAVFLLDNERLYAIAQRYSLSDPFHYGRLGGHDRDSKTVGVGTVGPGPHRERRKKEISHHLPRGHIGLDRWAHRGHLRNEVRGRHVGGPPVHPAGTSIRGGFRGRGQTRPRAPRVRHPGAPSRKPGHPVRLFDKDFPEIKDVDSKLVALGKDLGARVLTTDFNLNKVAALQGITVLNVNDLANALKPVVLPGEPMTLFVLKEGKEREQGVAYLDDGTMVVVEDGRRAIGQKVKVTVSSILQTSAGRLIFAKLQRGTADILPAAGPAEQAAHPDL